MAAADNMLIKKLARQGYGAISPIKGLLALQNLIGASESLIRNSVILSPFKWGTFLKGKTPLHASF